MSQALQFLTHTTAGWLSRQQEDAIEYLREENRVLREQRRHSHSSHDFIQTHLTRVEGAGLCCTHKSLLDHA